MLKISVVPNRPVSLSVASIAIALFVIAALLVSASLIPNDSSLSVYGANSDSALKLRGTLIAQCNGTDTVQEIILTVAIPEDGEPVMFTPPPSNIVDLSYIDENQKITDLRWKVEEYVQGDGDIMLERGETFQISALLGNALNHALEASTKFTIEIDTHDGNVMKITRTTPDQLEPVMNLE